MDPDDDDDDDDGGGGGGGGGGGDPSAHLSSAAVGLTHLEESEKPTTVDKYHDDPSKLIGML